MNTIPTAEKNFRIADSALKTQIATLNGDTIQKEDAVTDAKEALRLARINNGVKITDRKRYVDNIITATNNITIAEEALKDHKDLLEVLENTLKSFGEEVDA